LILTFDCFCNNRQTEIENIPYHRALIDISALQNGQSGAVNLVSTHFMTQWSWKMCLQGVSLIIVAGKNSSTQMAQLS